MSIHRPTRAEARRRAARHLALLAFVAASVSCSAGARGVAAAARGVYRPDVASISPATRAERSGFTETSSLADVRAFLDTLAAEGNVHVGSLGRSAEGRDIPYVIASRPLVRTPLAAKALDRPIVFIQGGIHGGEIEGKEAVLALLRDLTRQRFANVLDSVTIIAVPMYNPDGAERLGPQERTRPEQNGPALVGARTNGDTLDLNRDYIKAEAAETRAALRFLAAWDPDVFVDLHTTDGSYHGYAFTWAPPLNPASIVVQGWVRDTVLPELRLRMRTHHRIESFPYGNFVSQDSVEQGWFTYDHRPRFGTNYMGLRGRPAVLFEAYSHDPYPVRVRTAYAFLFELLDMVSVSPDDFLDIGREADRRATGWGTEPASAPLIPIRAAMGPSSRRELMLVESVERVADSVRVEAGMPTGLRRGPVRRIMVPIHDRFRPTLVRPMAHGYAIPYELAEAIERLHLHGVVMERLQQPLDIEVEQFTVDTIVRESRRFQQHNTVRLQGRWVRGRTTLPAGMVLVRSGQPRSVLAMYLLEPESDDGLVTWNVLDPHLAEGASFPIVRLTEPVSAPLTVLDR